MKLEFLQLISPSLPVGAFSYSEGLEWLAQNKKVYDETTLFNWIESELLRGQITIEASSISHIMRDLVCLLYTSPSPRDQRGSRMPSSA